MRLKKIFLLFICIFLLLVSQVYGEGGFNTKNAYNITKELSSAKYRGRVVGDKGNELAQDYITAYFKNLGLKPGGDNNSYLQKFDVYAPSTEGPCYFKVYDSKGKIVKEYVYGKDFKEMTYGASIEGTISGTLKTSTNQKGSIMLSEYREIAESPGGYDRDMKLKSSGINAVLVPSNDYLRFRSPYKLQRPCGDGIVKLYVSNSIVSELKEFAAKNYSFEIKSTVKTEKIQANNVIGIIEGRNIALPPIVLSAHFDHVGFDADGTIYSGAFDNASGTAFLLEYARFLKASGTPERTIIIAAFNAEEVGLIGSKYFVQNPPMDIKDAECINFDMVGSSTDMPISIIHAAVRTEFPEEILNLAQASKIPAKTGLNASSDHAYFCYKGIKAVTLIQYDASKIHTPMDTMDIVREKNFEEFYLLLNTFLSSRNSLAANAEVKEASPAIRYLLPGVLILVITTIGVLYFYSRTEQGKDL